VGIRDFAIMMLVARLGLRSIEVARLELRDMDWRSGELVVRGKARRLDRLPLPAEVGEALVAYLSCGRNPVDAVHVFLTCRAPRGPIRADLVGDVVERACKRAGSTRLAHIVCGMLWPANCCVMVQGWSLSARFFATRIWPLLLFTPRSISTCCATLLSPGPEPSDERLGAGSGGLPETASFTGT